MMYLDVPQKRNKRAFKKANSNEEQKNDFS